MTLDVVCPCVEFATDGGKAMAPMDCLPLQMYLASLIGRRRDNVRFGVEVTDGLTVPI